MSYQELERITRKYNPHIDAIFKELESIEHQSAVYKRAKDRTPLNIPEIVAKKRFDELIRVQLDNLEWKQNHPAIHDFMQQHPNFRFLFFGQILTDDELDQVKQEVEIFLQMQLFSE